MHVVREMMILNDDIDLRHDGAGWTYMVSTPTSNHFKIQDVWEIIESTLPLTCELIFIHWVKWSGFEMI